MLQQKMDIKKMTLFQLQTPMDNKSFELRTFPMDIQEDQTDVLRCEQISLFWHKEAAGKVWVMHMSILGTVGPIKKKNTNKSWILLLT